MNNENDEDLDSEPIVKKSKINHQEKIIELSNLEFVDYQIGDILIKKRDTFSLNHQNWLTNNIIQAFMNALTIKKKIIVIDYIPLFSQIKMNISNLK